MADYPTLRQSIGTYLVMRSGVVERLASNGEYNVNALYSAPKFDAVVVHDYITAAERATLLDFYNDNRLTTFNFIAAEDGLTRTCVFSAIPFEIEPVRDAPWYYRVTVYLREV